MKRTSLIFVLVSLCLFSSTLYGAEGGQQPEAFALDLQRDGTAFSGSLGLNEELVVTAQVQQLGTPSRPVLSNLIWQLYTVAGDPLPSFNKTRQIIGLGQQEYCRFEIRAGALANGGYFVGLTHQNATDPTDFYQASEPFRVNQPLAIKEVLVAESPRGETGQHIFYEDQSPLVFVYYFLAEDVFTALVQIDVLDQNGVIRASRTVHKDKDFSKKRERVGIKLPPALFKAGEKATVQVSLSSSDNITVTATTWFEVLAVDLGLNFPGTMKQGTVENFQLFVPQTFTSPYRVQFSQNDGFIIRIEDGSLTGKLVVTGAAEIGTHAITVTVVDGSGNQAEGSVSLEVTQGKNLGYQHLDHQSGTVNRRGGHIGSSTRR